MIFIIDFTAVLQFYGRRELLQNLLQKSSMMPDFSPAFWCLPPFYHTILYIILLCSMHKRPFLCSLVHSPLSWKVKLTGRPVLSKAVLSPGCDAAAQVWQLDTSLAFAGAEQDWKGRVVQAIELTWAEGIQFAGLSLKWAGNNPKSHCKL